KYRSAALGACVGIGVAEEGALTKLAEVAVLIPHLLNASPVEESFWLLTAVTIAAAAIFAFEGLRFRKKAKRT
ncbi:MAG TPA: hypothetical protein V6C97_05755, partial [Oculatellaceae cyanobacterium]